MLQGPGSPFSGGENPNIGLVSPPEHLAYADQQGRTFATPLDRQQIRTAAQNNPAARQAILAELYRRKAQQTPGAPYGEPTGQPERTQNPTIGTAYGLGGAEDAIRTGLSSSLAALDTGVSRGIEALREGQAGGAGALTAGEARGQRNLERIIERDRRNLAPYQQAGTGTAQIMADLSGASGPEAQAAAYQAFESSPGYQFARDEAMRGVLQNAAATGGLGGGNVLRALQDRAANLASTEYGNYYNRLADLAGRGIQASQIGAGLTGQQTGLGTGLTQTAMQGQAGQAGDLGRALANLYSTGGTQAANILGGAGTNLANMRFTTGRDMANLTSQTGTGLGQMTAQQGLNLANYLQQIGAPMSNLYTGGALANAGALQNLGTLLANLSTGYGTNMAGVNAALGQAQAAGQLGSAAGLRTGLTDLGGLALMLPGLGGGGNAPVTTGNNQTLGGINVGGWMDAERYG
jgi:hypothetical protein